MLFQLIEGDKYGLNSRVEHEPEMRKEDTFSLIDAFLSNRNEEPEPYLSPSISWNSIFRSGKNIAIFSSSEVKLISFNTARFFRYNIRAT